MLEVNVRPADRADLAGDRVETPYYLAEFRVTAPGRFDRHNLAVFRLTAGGRLVTLTVTANEADWAADSALRAAARAMAGSLRVQAE